MKIIATILLPAFILTTFSVFVHGQDVRTNMIIQCNDRLVDSQLTNMRFKMTTTKNEYVFDVGYWPGDLIIPKKIYNVIISDSVRSLKLLFDLNTFVKNKHFILNVTADLAMSLISQPYLILNVYDFRDKNYKRQLGYLTDDEFICEFSFPGSVQG